MNPLKSNSIKIVPAFNAASTYLKLRPDARAEALPVTANFWPDLIQGRFGDFHNEYLVTMHSFDAKWPHWEMHPNGDEIVCLISGSVDMTLDQAGELSTVSLRKVGDFVLVEKGAWHIANPLAATTLLFISAGEGTTHRPA
jgi:mannose-6-phosphate isomerase-like protein (cupin superfamily)